MPQWLKRRSKQPKQSRQPKQDPLLAGTERLIIEIHESYEHATALHWKLAANLQDTMEHLFLARESAVKALRDANEKKVAAEAHAIVAAVTTQAGERSS